jgi:hypothetical protein
MWPHTANMPHQKKNRRSFRPAASPPKNPVGVPRPADVLGAAPRAAGIRREPGGSPVAPWGGVASGGRAVAPSIIRGGDRRNDSSEKMVRGFEALTVYSMTTEQKRGKAGQIGVNNGLASASV